MIDGISKQSLLSLDEVWCIWNRARGIGRPGPAECPKYEMLKPFLDLSTK